MSSVKSTLSKAPAGRALLAVLTDARTWLVSLLLGLAFVGGVGLLHAHVRVRAWVAILMILVFLLFPVVLDAMRAHERDKAMKLQGALERAEERATQAERRAAEIPTPPAEPPMNPSARDLLSGIAALRSSLWDRLERSGDGSGTFARGEEVHRYNLLAGRTRGLLKSSDGQLLVLLQQLTHQYAEEYQDHRVDRLLSGIDLMENEIQSWGQNNPGTV